MPKKPSLYTQKFSLEQKNKNEISLSLEAVSFNVFFQSRIETYFRLKNDQSKALKSLGIISLYDLLYYFPKKYIQNTDAISINNLHDDTKEHIVFGKITNLKIGKTFKTKLPMATAMLRDDSATVKLMWIRQPYIAKIIQNDSLVKVVGKASKKNGTLTFINPQIESVSIIPEHVGQPLFNKEHQRLLTKDILTRDDNQVQHIAPTYAETKGITSLWFYHAFKKIFADSAFGTLTDPIPDDMRKKYNLPTLITAFIWIHSPQREQDAEVARKRFAFEEIFFIQLRSQIEKQKAMKEKSFVIKNSSSAHNFIERMPFTMTDGQLKSIDEIINDMKRGYPMSRLLEGDVGSGKTAIAATAAYTVVKERPKDQKFGTLQVAYMAPTEILAKQHFESFINLFKHLPISIGLITGKECRKFPSKLNPKGWTNISRSQLSKWVANGEIAIVIGTHALIQKSVAFKHLALVVIDEQHRFGTNQRQKLARKHDITPHLLSMTATPIPRTLALTLYGDLDLSILDQMPHGRKNTITEIVKPDTHKNAYEHIRTELLSGRQAYIICPRIEESEEDLVSNPLINEQAKSIKNMKSVVGEAKRLKKEIFPEWNIGILHGKMKPTEKEEAMNKFMDKKIDILVATSVVEVGVNVPNASIILIEHADRYGLSQLHQLRGRVIRGNHQPYCYLATETTSDKSTERLNAIKTTKNGFDLAEMDLQMRGTGDLYGDTQWGVSDIAMNAIKNLKMVEAARTEAREIVAQDSLLQHHSHLRHELTLRNEVHFE